MTEPRIGDSGATRRRTLLLIGSGEAAYREYALRSIAAKADVVLVAGAHPTWERHYCADHVLVDLADADAVTAALRGHRPDALLTYDERYVELAARLGAALGLPGPAATAVTAVKDKSVLRALLESANLSPMRFGVATSIAQARAVVAAVGLPAVFKPRALGGSAGVRLITGPDQIEAAFADATSARVGTTRSRYPGVLIEEFIDGPEISVDCVVTGGVCTPLVVAEKRTGLAPYFEEIGHVVPAPAGLVPPAALELVVAAHKVAGLDEVVTHTEVKLSPVGPRIVEINARLGGDLIPYLGRLAIGVDLAAAAADIALGDPVRTGRHETGVAAVRFVYPERDLRVRDVRLRRPAARYPGLDTFARLVEPGEEVALPPRGYMSRLAVLVARAGSREECLAALEVAVGEVVVQADRPGVIGPGTREPV